jgi:hypothetical protein
MAAMPAALITPAEANPSAERRKRGDRTACLWQFPEDNASGGDRNLRPGGDGRRILRRFGGRAQPVPT